MSLHLKSRGHHRRENTSNDSLASIEPSLLIYRSEWLKTVHYLPFLVIHLFQLNQMTSNRHEQIAVGLCIPTSTVAQLTEARVEWTQVSIRECVDEQKLVFQWSRLFIQL